MYQYQLIYTVPLLSPMLKLERFLNSLCVPAPVGLYSKYRFKPILFPGKDYYLTENNVERYFTYEEIYSKMDLFSKLSPDQIISVFDDEGRYLCKTRDLTVHPHLPIRSQELLNDIFQYSLMSTRKWIHNTIFSITDDAIEYGIMKLLFNPQFELDYIFNRVSIEMEGHIEEISTFIRQHGWNELFIELHDDIFSIFDMGDYRIRHYMEKHKRNDY